MTKTNKQHLRERIEKGIKFFRRFEKKYDGVVFKKYWPKFLDLVNEYIAEPVQEKKEDLVEMAKKLGMGKEEK